MLHSLSCTRIRVPFRQTMIVLAFIIIDGSLSDPNSPTSNFGLPSQSLPATHPDVICLSQSQVWCARSKFKRIKPGRSESKRMLGWINPKMLPCSLRLGVFGAITFCAVTGVGLGATHSSTTSGKTHDMDSPEEGPPTISIHVEK